PSSRTPRANWKMRTTVQCETPSERSQILNERRRIYHRSIGGLSCRRVVSRRSPALCWACWFIGGSLRRRCELSWFLLHRLSPRRPISNLRTSPRTDDRNLGSMLTIRAMSDGKGYSARHLEHSDYYAEGERVVGRWFGRGTELLGLS